MQNLFNDVDQPPWELLFKDIELREDLNKPLVIEGLPLTLVGNDNPLVDCPKCDNDPKCDFCLGNGKVSELRYMLHKYPKLHANLTPEVKLAGFEKADTIQWEKGIKSQNNV